MLPDWPHHNNGYCLIVHQLAQWRPTRCYTGIVNSNLPSGKSSVTQYAHQFVTLLCFNLNLNHNLLYWCEIFAKVYFSHQRVFNVLLGYTKYRSELTSPATYYIIVYTCNIFFDNVVYRSDDNVHIFLE